MYDISQVQAMVLGTHVWLGTALHVYPIGRRKPLVTETEYQTQEFTQYFSLPFPNRKKKKKEIIGNSPDSVSIFLSIIIPGWKASGWLQSYFDPPERAVPVNLTLFWFQNAKLPWLPVVWPLVSSGHIFSFLKCSALRLQSFSLYHGFWISPVQRNLL